MSEIAKKARAAMKAKAKNLADRPVEKVDSSDWTPPPLLNADVKTGMRPVSRRAFKSGGKVSGEANKARADRKARKSGGSAEQPIVDRYINRDLKKANEYRDGEKHIGGLKRGGRAKKAEGGDTGSDEIGKMIRQTQVEEGMKGRGQPAKVPLPPRRPAEKPYKYTGPAPTSNPNTGYKKGGRAGKADGGPMMDPRLGIVKPKAMEFGQNVVTPGLKKGGKAEHPDVAQDKALIKKMIKPSAMKDGKCYGGRAKKQTGGGVFTGPGYPGKVPGVTGGRIAKAKGGSRSAVGKEFDEEFRKKREEGAKTFEFRGKTYSTDLAPSAPPSGGPTRRGMGRPTGMMREPSQNYMDARPELSQPATGMTQTHRQPGLFIGRPGEPAIVFERDMPGPAPLREAPNVTYGGGQYGTSADPASRIAAPAPAPTDNRMGRGQPSVTEYGLFGGRPGAYGEKAINFSREVPAYPADAFMPRARGGRTKGKGKTNINIVIAAGRHKDEQPAMPAMPPRGPAMPPMPPMAGAGMPPMGGGMAPGAGAPPMPPMGRKSGGRVTKVAKSYKDMEAGAGSGEGRLQKTDIAKRTMHKDGGKVGHRTYRSYKDMDAGSGSGLGRLEKTEIESKKR